MGMRVKAFTEEQIAEWEKMRDAGMTYSTIARKTGACRDTIYRHLGAEKISGHSRKSPVKIDKNKIEEMDIYKELGLSNAQIAIEMGLSKTTVQRYLGPQKDDRRSKYGSLVSHATGETYVPKGYDLVKMKEERKMEKAAEPGKQEEIAVAVAVEEKPVEQPPVPQNPLRVASFELVLEGHKCIYKLRDGAIYMYRGDSCLVLANDDISELIGELEHLKEFMSVSAFKLSVA